MPVSKDAFSRYRVIDRLLSDPNQDYTTEKIHHIVNRECEDKVTLRMIQKDIKAIEEDFGKEMVRNDGGRGTVKYKDQSTPLFYQELTVDEENLLREVLKTLGQFEGLDNFTWLALLKKKLGMSGEKKECPLISFGVKDTLQIDGTILGRLYTAISRRQVLRVKYTPFGKPTGTYDIYPYQLRQYNDRWFLLLNTVGNEEHPYNRELILNFALDRLSPEFEYLDDVPYIDTPVDLQARFDEIVGVTLLADEEVEAIYYAVSPARADYVRSKFIHSTQQESEGDELQEYRSRYPWLKDWAFFSIECRPNKELYGLFASFGEDLVVLEPCRIRDEMARKLREAAGNYARTTV